MIFSEKLQIIRKNHGFTQEELAGKLNVSRQAVAKWESGKNYPDIHSVLLLSSIFNISLDQLIKGDIEIMKKEISQTEIKKFNQIAIILALLLILTIISIAPLLKFMGLYGFIPWLIIFGVTLHFADKAEKIKKENDISTYKEIVAFTEGKQLDEIEKQREIGKRPYQTVCYVIGTAIISFLAVYVIAYLIKL